MIGLSSLSAASIYPLSTPPNLCRVLRGWSQSPAIIRWEVEYTLDKLPVVVSVCWENSSDVGEWWLGVSKAWEWYMDSCQREVCSVVLCGWRRHFWREHLKQQSGENFSLTYQMLILPKMCRFWFMLQPFRSRAFAFILSCWVCWFIAWYRRSQPPEVDEDDVVLYGTFYSGKIYQGPLLGCTVHSTLS